MEAFMTAQTVTHDVPPFALMVGVPARRVGWMCQCGERLSDKNPTGCAVCGTKYRLDGEMLRRIS